MRLQIFTLLCSVFVLVLATGKLEDKSDIDDLLNAFNLYIDGKQYSKLGEIFTRDVTYDPGPRKDPGQLVQGLDAIINIPKTEIPDTVVSFTQLSTKLIKFVPPFDRKGRSDRAEAVSYNFNLFFGAGNLTGQTYFFYIKYVDKEIVRTNETGYGGWRIKFRKLELVVSFISTNICAAYHRPLDVVSQSKNSTLLIEVIFRATLSETPLFWKDRGPILATVMFAGEQRFERGSEVTAGVTKLMKMLTISNWAYFLTSADVFLEWPSSPSLLQRRSQIN